MQINIFEEYKISIDQANKLLDRKQNTTTIYISINSAIIAIMAFLFKDGKLESLEQKISVSILLLSGLLMCILWDIQVKKYIFLLKTWYRYIRSIEKEGDIYIKVFTKEYTDIYSNSDRSRFSVSFYELFMIKIIIFIYIVFILSVSLSIFI